MFPIKRMDSTNLFRTFTSGLWLRVWLSRFLILRTAIDFQTISMNGIALFASGTYVTKDDDGWLPFLNIAA